VSLGGECAPLHRFVERMVRLGASDLHLAAGDVPCFRVDGVLQRPARTGEVTALTVDDVETMARSLLSTARWDALLATGDADGVSSWPVAGRLRVNARQQVGGMSLAIRRLSSAIPTCEQLGIPAVVVRSVERPRGLVLVTGPTGSGKSTTLASLADHLLRTRAVHLLTLEDPVEYLLTAHRGVVSQRCIGEHTGSMAGALRYALRADPDVVCIGELRDAESMQAALTVAETGHLVLATMHTNGAAEAVHRILDGVPGGHERQVAAQLAMVLEAVVMQQLLPHRGGQGRVLVAEVLVGTAAARALIREGKVHQLPALMESGRRFGMATLDDALQVRWLAREITREQCIMASRDPARWEGVA